MFSLGNATLRHMILNDELLFGAGELGRQQLSGLDFSAGRGTIVISFFELFLLRRLNIGLHEPGIGWTCGRFNIFV